jgi:uncharacterized YigZ family protein
MAYAIPAQEHRTEIVVVNSRFITAVNRADSVASARDFIARQRTAMPDASHHVYAYRIGGESSVIEGMSDDGEPSGTSGPPTLAVVRGSGLGDIVLVTTRYFGGTKLGTGGLVRAYTEAAQTALATLPTTLKVAKVLLGVELPYSLYESAKRIIAQYNGVIESEDFAETVSMYVLLLQSDQDAFSKQIITLTAGQVTPLLLEERAY